MNEKFCNYFQKYYNWFDSIPNQFNYFDVPSFGVNSKKKALIIEKFLMCISTLKKIYWTSLLCEKINLFLSSSNPSSSLTCSHRLPSISSGSPCPHTRKEGARRWWLWSSWPMALIHRVGLSRVHRGSGSPCTTKDGASTILCCLHPTLPPLCLVRPTLPSYEEGGGTTMITLIVLTHGPHA